MTAIAKRPKAKPENAIARSALEQIEQIEREAQAKKMAQLESLGEAKTNIRGRIQELEHQLHQIEEAIAKIKGIPLPSEKKRARRDLTEDRARVHRWMESHRGEHFGAGELVKNFPELDGTPMSIFLKPLIKEGKIKTDSTEGAKRTKYFIPA